MTDIPYTLIRSDRSTISLEITDSGGLLVRCPQEASVQYIDKIVESKRSWIEKHRNRRANPAPRPALTLKELHELADRAMAHIPQRVRHFAPIVGVTYNNITIRNQRTRWGSCSGKGNLNFNCLLMLCPPRVLDYVVVHELCHRKEMNHSPRFWAEVERVMPDYRQSRQWLKDNGHLLISRLGQG